MLATLLSAVFTLAADISSIRIVDDGESISKIVFSANDLNSQSVKIFEIPGNNPRIVIDFRDSKSQLLKNGNYENKPGLVVKAIRGAVRDNQQVRFVIDMLPGNKFAGHSIENNALSLKITKVGQVKNPVKPIFANSVRPTDVPVPRIKPKAHKKPVIVIDAGHGGRDPGGLGTTGLREKNVALQAALELKAQLLATGRYKVVLTRGNDRYIEHEDRLRIARANSADLFISLHADATAGKTARGASVYTLADRAKNRSKRIVDSQNWIMDVNLSEQNDKVSDILVDLAQRNTASQSTKFADILISKLGFSTQLLRNTHRRAGYYVLLAPDVPAVLLELGFISNPNDENLLKSSSHRQKLMRSVVSAIDDYFSR